MPLAYIHWIKVPGMPENPVDPGYSPPWAQVPPGHTPGSPVDPGYSPPWAQVPPGTGPGGPVDPGYSPPWAQVPPGTKPPTGPVDPGYSPPWAQIPPGSPGTPGWNVPHPSHPIMLPGMPGWGLIPVVPNPPPLRPTHPIFFPPGTQPGEPGYGLGNWPHPDQGLPEPQPPTVPEKPPKPEEELPPGGTAPEVPPTIENPVLVFIPQVGWYWVQLAPPSTTEPPVK